MEVSIHDKEFFEEMKQKFTRDEGKVFLDDEFIRRSKIYIKGVINDTVDFYCSFCRPHVVELHREDQKKMLSALENEKTLSCVISLIRTAFSFNTTDEKQARLISYYELSHLEKSVPGNNPDIIFDSILRYIIYNELLDMC